MAPQLRRTSLGGRDHRTPNHHRSTLIPHTTKEWLAGAFVTVLGGLGFTYGIWSVFEGWAAKRWPVTVGVVTATSIRLTGSRWGNNYEPCVSYSFTVAGTHYTGERLRFGDSEYQFKWSAEADLIPYGVGLPVEVHYHPVDHSRSVLEPGVSLSTYSLLGVGGIVAAAGIGFLLGILH